MREETRNIRCGGPCSYVERYVDCPVCNHGENDPANYRRAKAKTTGSDQHKFKLTCMACNSGLLDV